MITKSLAFFVTAACLLAFPLLSPAATAYLTVGAGENIHFNVSGSTDGNVTVVDLSNNATVANITAYCSNPFTYGGTIYYPATLVSDGSGNAEIDGLPAGNYALTFTSLHLADYSDDYGSDWAELELFDDLTDSGWFMECEVGIY